MKPKRSNPLFAGFFRRNHLATAIIVSLAGFAPLQSSSAATLFWDANSDAAGCGDVGGTWDSGTNWTTDSSGLTTPTVGWTNGENVVFSAGSDGTGAWTVTLAGTVATPSILFEESGAKTISGGVINIAGGSINTAAAGNGNLLTISSALAGTGNLTVTANGDLSDSGGGVGGATLLSGANTITGDITINGGLLRSNGSFGNASNKVILSGGGIVDPNLNTNFTHGIEIPATKTGIYRTYGSVSTGQISGAITGAGTLRHTDGGTLKFSGDGSAFTGAINNARGNLNVATSAWSGTHFVNQDGSKITFSAAGTTTIKSYEGDRDVGIDNLLNIATGTYSVTNGAAVNGFWVTGAGSMTSNSGTLTVTNGAATGNLSTTDHQIQVNIVDFDGSTPLTLVKNNVNNLTLTKPNTYTGGTTINGGRINASATASFGTGTVTVNDTAQAYLATTGTYANDFVINGPGITEGAGTLGAIRFQNNTVSGDITVATAARITAHSGATGTLTGALLGSADLEINSTATSNNGTITLNDASSFTGALTLSQGTLNVGALGGNLALSSGSTANVSGTVAGATTINGGTLNVNAGGTITGNAVTLAAATINLAGSITGDLTIEDQDILGLAGGSVGGNVSMGPSGFNANQMTLNFTNTLAVTGNLQLRGTETVNLKVVPSPGTPITLISYGGTATDPDDADTVNNFVLTNSGDWRAAAFTDTGSAITLSLGGETHKWVGNHGTNPSFWDTTTSNWSSTDNLFFNGDSVTFDDTASSYTVALQGTYSPFSMTVNNSTNAYSITGGGITGSAGITKTGTNALTLGGANTYTGAVSVNAGVLSLGSQLALGNTSGITVASNARVNLNGNAPGAAGGFYSWTIAGDGGDGAGGVGAITNTGGDVYGNSGVKNLTLSANAEIGGNNGRFDIGLSGGALDGGGFTLTKVGSNQTVLRTATSTNVNLVVNGGTLNFEDSDAASGSNPITVNNTAVVGTYGTRSIANDVTLNTGTTLSNLGGGTGTWTGTLTATGPVTLNTGGNIVIDGALAGAGNITRTGANTLYLQNTGASYTGKITSASGGTLRIESPAALGIATGANVLTLGGGVTLQGGTVALQSSATIGSATQGITTTGNVNFGAGPGNTITINGPFTGVGNLTKNNNAGDALIFNKSVTTTGKFTGNNGTLTFNDNISFDSGLDVGTDMVTNINGTTANIGTGIDGFHAWRGTTNIDIGSGTFADLELGDGGTQPHTVNHLGGDLAVTNDMRIGHWGGATCVYNISAGSVSLPESASPTNESQSNLMLGIDGSGILNISGTGVVNTSSLVVNGRNNTNNGGQDALNLNGGRLNLGKWGMRTQGSTYAVNLGTGTVGAYADWSSSLNMTLGGTTTFDTLDSVDGTTPRSITLTGVMSGTGGLLKDGAGTLALSNAANTFSGTAEVTEGTLYVNSANNATLRTSGTGDLRPGTLSAVGSPFADTVDLNGGSVTFRVGDTQDKIDTIDLTVTSASSVSLIPTRALTTSDSFNLIYYTGSIGGLGIGGLSVALSNPHYGVSLHDTGSGIVYADIDSADSLSWKGGFNGNWDVNTTFNWTLDSDGVTTSKFYDFDVVTFGDAGISQPVVTLTGAIKPAVVSVANTAGTYTFQGSGISSGSLSKSAAGALVLLNNNSYTGATSITGGSVAVGNGGTTGTLGGLGTITLSGATLAFDRSDAQTLSRTVTGTGGTVVKNGAGGLTMSAGSNTCDITVNAGTLYARGGGFSAAFAAGKTITVNTGASLDTVTHSMGSSVGGGGDVPKVTLNGGSWVLNNEQYMRTLTMTAGTTSGAGEIRVLSGSLFTVNTSATSSTIGSRVNLYSGLNLVVNDGAAANDLVISGEVHNGGTFIKSGDGTAVLTATNTYTNTTTINAGVVQIGNGGTTGSLGTGGVTNNATLRFNRSNAHSVANVIAGTGDVEKNGAGTMTVTGLNTYTGDTTINAGTFQLADNAQLKFAPGANGVCNKITGTGSVELLGDFTIDLSGADLTNGNSWTLVDAGSLSETYLSSFTVVGFTESANVHTLVDGSNTWTFDEASGVLSLSIAGGYSTWAATNAPAGTAADDYDGDGVSNGVEYVLGGTAGTNDLGKLPSATVSGGNLVFTFLRDQASKTSDVAVSIQVGTNLVTWPSVYTVGDDTGSSTAGVTVTDNLDGTDTITLTVAMSPDAAKFGRLNVVVTTP